MDDDQMMAVDKQLAAIFSERTNEKKVAKGSLQLVLSIHTCSLRR